MAGTICQALPRPRDGLDEPRQLREPVRLVVYHFVMQRLEAPHELRAAGEGRAGGEKAASVYWYTARHGR